MITLVVAGVVVACAMVTEAMIAATKQGSLPCSLRDYERLEVAGHSPVPTCADSWDGARRLRADHATAGPRRRHRATIDTWGFWGSRFEGGGVYDSVTCSCCAI